MIVPNHRRKLFLIMAAAQMAAVSGVAMSEPAQPPPPDPTCRPVPQVPAVEPDAIAVRRLPSKRRRKLKRSRRRRKR